MSPGDEDKSKRLRERFPLLIKRFATGLESAAELEELGVIVIQQATVWEKWLNLGEGHPAMIWEHLAAHAARLAEAGNPWGMLQVLIKNKLLDQWRSERTRRRREMTLVGRDEENGMDGIEDSLVGADPAIGPAEEALFCDEWAELESILKEHHNQSHVFFFRDWAVGWKVVDIAETYGVTQNHVQLAVGYVREFVLKTTLIKRRQNLQEVLAGYPHPAHVEILWEWVAGKPIKAIAQERGLMKCELKSAIASLIKFLARRWHG